MTKRYTLLLLCLAGVVACPKDKKRGAADTAVAVAPPLTQDTTPTDLSAVQSNLPPVAPDTFTRRKLPRPPRQPAETASRYPAAPAELMAAVERSQTFSKFCYQEFGQKADPSLRGGVAMLVTVDASGVADAKVANDSWSSGSGKAVNSCLNERAKTAWKLSPGAVKSGKYVVQLAFSGG
ncbi:MAG TPA: hypothetical protein VFJ74_05800 [Gemmatimonadaceae bacterium]|nr:hypothetical protein [Gemmatimonadaceae bacterium]